jgi:hypothetical protein
LKRENLFGLTLSLGEGSGERN